MCWICNAKSSPAAAGAWAPRRAFLLAAAERDPSRTYFGDRSSGEPFAFLHRG